MRGDADRGRRARTWGRRAERLTVWLMWARGWDLEAANLRLGRSELDLVMSRGDELRLLEVKARRAGAWSGADSVLHPEQRLRLQRGLRSFLDRAPWPGRITFQRVSWAGLKPTFHPPERWEALRG